MADDHAYIDGRLVMDSRQDLVDEIERLRGGLDAAIRAANLALFVINKAGVMPNSSWESGFKSDLAKATAARAPTGKTP